MKIPCELIFDLLPLYQEDLCSEVTKEFVEEHLKECPQCQQLLESSQITIFEANPISETQIDEKSAKILNDVKHKMNRKTKSISILLAITSFLLLIGGARLYFGQEKPVNQEQITVLTQEQNGSDSAEWPEPTHEEFWVNRQENGAVDLGFNTWFTGGNVLRRTINTENGVRDVIYMNITRNSWDHFFNNFAIENGSQGSFVIDNQSFQWENFSNGINMRAFDRSSANEIIAVYYLVADFNKLNEMDLEQFHEATADAFLLWEQE